MPYSENLFTWREGALSYLGKVNFSYVFLENALKCLHAGLRVTRLPGTRCLLPRGTGSFLLPLPCGLVLKEFLALTITLSDCYIKTLSGLIYYYLKSFANFVIR